jgi:hypothetical protein
MGRPSENGGEDEHGQEVDGQAGQRHERGVPDDLSEAKSGHRQNRDGPERLNQVDAGDDRGAYARMVGGNAERFGGRQQVRGLDEPLRPPEGRKRSSRPE